MDAMNVALLSVHSFALNANEHRGCLVFHVYYMHSISPHSSCILIVLLGSLCFLTFIFLFFIMSSFTILIMVIFLQMPLNYFVLERGKVTNK